MEKESENWSETVEDLVAAGDTDTAISLLESLLQTLNPSDSQLPSALSQLASLYSSKDFSLKADELRSRASLIAQQIQRSGDARIVEESKGEGVASSSKVSVFRGDSDRAKYGTGHVLVLADFPPSMRTTELEKLFEGFKDRGFVIRWVSDTVALAVFRTPSVALEARNSIRCPFTVRILDEDDTLLSSIKARDLEPPRQRPKTSAQAAQRLIAHGMGLKLPSSGFGSGEYRKQEDARRERIVTRQKLRDEAWGDD